MLVRIDLYLALALGMLGIVMYLIPKSPFVIICLLIIAFCLSFYIVWTFPWIRDSFGRRLGGLLFVAACLCLLGDYVWPAPSYNLKPPSLKVDVFPTNVNIFDKYPMQRYKLMIQNRNSDSATIFNFSIEFIFKGQIVEIKPMPLFPPGQGGIGLGGIEMHVKNKHGKKFNYEEQQVETSMTKKFSLVIQQAKINNKLVNTNILIFDCEKWPEKYSYAADILLDLSKISLIQKKSENTYSGEYSYELNGQKYTEKIQGSIRVP